MIILVNIIIGVSVDCPDIINLALGLYMNIQSSSIMSSLYSNCCSATGVTCNGYTRVTQISWVNKGLNGVLNGTALPATLTYLDLNYNFISGAVPTSWPSGMTRITIGPNLLTGSLTNVVWPNGLQTLEVDGNSLGGDLPAFPLSLLRLDLGDYTPTDSPNHFTGTLSLFRPITVKINNNWITDVIISDISSLSSCAMMNNPLLGNPNLIPLTMCDTDGIYSPSLLPNTLSYIRTPSTMLTAESDTQTIRIETTHLVKFKINPTAYLYNLFYMMKMVIRLMLDVALISAFIMKVPFKRELKRAFKSKKTANGNISVEV